MYRGGEAEDERRILMDEIWREMLEAARAVRRGGGSPNT